MSPNELFEQVAPAILQHSVMHNASWLMDKHNYRGKGWQCKDIDCVRMLCFSPRGDRSLPSVCYCLAPEYGIERVADVCRGKWHVAAAMVDRMDC